jgi:hypothetical protein
MTGGEVVFQCILGFIVGLVAAGVYKMCKKWYDRN